MEIENPRVEFDKLLKQLTFAASFGSNTISIVDAVRNLESCAKTIVPKTLYRFRNGEHLDSDLECILNETVYLSHADRFKDNKDSVVHIDEDVLISQIKEQVTKDNVLELFDKMMHNTSSNSMLMSIRMRQQEIETTFDRALEQFIKEVTGQARVSSQKYRECFRIACLTEELYSPQMWKEYAARGSGYCIEYEVPEDDFYCSCRDRACLDGRYVLSLYPVLYGEQFDASEYSDKVMGAYGHHVFPTAMDYLLQVNAIVRKTTQWSWEQEWRIVAPGCEETEDEMYAHLKASAVFLGNQIEPDKQGRIIEVARNKGLPVFKNETMERKGKAIIEVASNNNESI